MIFAACNPSRHLEDGQYLLVKNDVTLQDNQDIPSYEIESFIKQNPNKKLLGLIPLKTSSYFFSQGGKKNWLRKYVEKTFAEEPVILDTILSYQTSEQISLYLNTKGFFYAEVNHTNDFRKKKARVTYHVLFNKPYRIRNYSVVAHDNQIKYLTDQLERKDPIEKGDIYDVEALEDERSAIAKYLRNNGYYFFSKEYINFLVDSNLSSRQMNIQCIIDNPVHDKTDSLQISGHKRYRIRQIHIYPDFNPLLTGNGPYTDTIIRVQHYREKDRKDNYYFHYSKNLTFKPKTITQSIFISHLDFFNLDDLQKTYDRLSDLRNYKYINISFEEAESNSTDTSIHRAYFLDCFIKLTPSPRQSFSIETEGTNSAGNFGVAGNFVYQNKNLLKGAEIFRLKLKGALEMQQVVGKRDEGSLFNTFESGIESSLNIPKFLIPIRQERFPKYFKPKTNINLGFYYQQRPDYSRYITDISFGYEWKENPRKKHLLYPLSLNSVSVFLDSAFMQTLESYSKTLQNQYTDHIISALKYSFIFSNQEIYKNKDFTYFRANFESAGNLLALSQKAGNASKNADKQYLVFNIPFSQYIKIDADYRYYNIVRSESSLVFRTLIGLGLPYGNSDVMPYEKSFYAGGSNDIRAWRLRSLGPGSFIDTSGSDFDKTGDIKFELNLENRFPIYKLLHGALFLDAGNIWLINKSDEFPGGEFRFNTFLNEIALGGGFGLRVDFDFFIIRFDFALPLRDPRIQEKNKWLIDELQFRKFFLNFGIGYPF